MFAVIVVVVTGRVVLFVTMFETTVCLRLTSLLEADKDVLLLVTEQRAGHGHEGAGEFVWNLQRWNSGSEGSQVGENKNIRGRGKKANEIHLSQPVLLQMDPDNASVQKEQVSHEGMRGQNPFCPLNYFVSSSLNNLTTTATNNQVKTQTQNLSTVCQTISDILKKFVFILPNFNFWMFKYSSALMLLFFYTWSTSAIFPPHWKMCRSKTLKIATAVNIYFQVSGSTRPHHRGSIWWWEKVRTQYRFQTLPSTSLLILPNRDGSLDALLPYLKMGTRTCRILSCPEPIVSYKYIFWSAVIAVLEKLSRRLCLTAEQCTEEANWFRKIGTKDSLLCLSLSDDKC